MYDIDVDMVVNIIKIAVCCCVMLCSMVVSY